MEAIEYLKLATDKTEAGDLIKENNLTDAVAKLMSNYAEFRVKNCSIPAVVGQSEQLKAKDRDLSFADYLEKWYKLPRYEKVYDRKDGKGTDTEDEVIKNYRRAFRL